MSELPQSWTTAPLADLADIIRGVTYKKEDVSWKGSPELVPILRATNINGALDFEELVWVPQKYVDAGQLLQRGDIVIAASSGSASVVGKAAQLKDDWKGSFGAFCMGLRPNPSFNPAYVAYYLQTSEYRNLVSSLAAGVNINNLKRQHIAEINLPTAPKPEQDRIVGEIEKQFTRLDDAVAALKRVQANLKRYRAAVLKAACEGRLVPTEAEVARKEGRSYEPASELLKRILAERRAKWEAAQLQKMIAAGKPPKDDEWKKKYTEPEVPHTTSLPPVPGGWLWVSLDQIADIQGGIQKQPKRQPKKNFCPYLRVANVYRGRLELSEIEQMELFGDELDKLRLQKNDLLIVEGNGSPSEIGRMAIWRGEIQDCVHQNHIIRARLASGVTAEFCAAHWNSPQGSSEVMQVASSTSGLYTLSRAKVARFYLPLPPVVEQTRIVKEVQRRLSKIDACEYVLQHQTRHASRLRQAVLKNAFAGKLVAQNPDDEPASVLLERILAVRGGKQPVSAWIDQGRLIVNANLPITATEQIDCARDVRTVKKPAQPERYTSSMRQRKTRTPSERNI
jgi:type I restriction enzyme S subunit